MRALAAVFVFAVSVFGQGVAVNPYPRPLVPAGGAASSVPASGVTGITNNIVPKGTAGGLGNSSITDNGTTVSTTEPISAPSIQAGNSPPSVTTGTGGVVALSEGTVPTVCAASAVDCMYADPTQHGFLANFNNAGYLPLVQGPATDVSGHWAAFSGTNGGKLVDGGAATTTVNGQACALGSTCTAIGNLVQRLTPLTAQSANVAATNLFTTAAANGYYQICAEAVETQQPTASGTVPGVQLIYVSAISSANIFTTVMALSAAGVGFNAAVVGCATIFVKASTTVQYQTFGYASVGATALQYALMQTVTSQNTAGN